MDDTDGSGQVQVGWGAADKSCLFEGVQSHDRRVDGGDEAIEGVPGTATAFYDLSVVYVSLTDQTSPLLCTHLVLEEPRQPLRNPAQPKRRHETVLRTPAPVSRSSFIPRIPARPLFVTQPRGVTL